MKINSSFKLLKAFWITVLVLSAVATWILISPAMEVYFGVNMPFVTINHTQFNCFGFHIPNDKQLGFMLLTGVLLMLPARTLHLSILKLSQKERRNFRNDNEFETDNDFTFNHMEFPCKSTEFPLKKK